MAVRDLPLLRTRQYIPASVAPPISLVLAAVYPASWNPSQTVQSWFTMIMVLGLVWLAVVVIVSFNKAMVTNTDAVVERQVRQLREAAFAELDAAERALFEQIVRGLTQPEG